MAPSGGVNLSVEDNAAKCPAQASSSGSCVPAKRSAPAKTRLGFCPAGHRILSGQGQPPRQFLPPQQRHGYGYGYGKTTTR